MFPKVFNSHQSKAQVESTGPLWNSPTCVAVHPQPPRWTQPLSRLRASSGSRRASGRQIPREWQPPGTCTGREPTSTPTSRTMGPPGQSLCSVSALRGCWRQPRACQTPRSQHHGGTFTRAGALPPCTPFLPQASLAFTKPTLSPQKPAQGHGTTPALLPEVPAPLSPSTQRWEGAKPGTEGQHGRGSGGSSGPGAALAPTLQQLSLHSGAATDSNNEMAALSTTLNKCHTLFLV